MWERVEAGGRRAEQRHVEVLQLYADLQQPQSAGDHLETWVSRLLDGQLTQLRTCLDEERQQREQVRYWARYQDVNTRVRRTLCSDALCEVAHVSPSCLSMTGNLL